MQLVRDVLRMIRDIRAASRIVDAWGAILNLPQLIGGLVFVGRLEGQLVFAGVVFSIVVAARIHRRQPLSRLMGICHAPWLGLAPFLAVRCAQVPEWTAFRGWLLYVTVTMTISLVFDVIDVIRYLGSSRRSYGWGDGARPGRDE